MKLIYACLLGNWVCLNDDENCTIGDNNQSPSVCFLSDMLPLRKGVKKMKLIYACLLGNWVCLNDDENCTIGDNNQSPSVWSPEKGGEENEVDLCMSPGELGMSQR